MSKCTEPRRGFQIRHMSKVVQFSATRFFLPAILTVLFLNINGHYGKTPGRVCVLWVCVHGLVCVGWLGWSICVCVRMHA